MKKLPKTVLGVRWYGIAEVVPPQAIVERQLTVDLPGVFDESAVRYAGRIPTVLGLFTGGRVVSDVCSVNTLSRARSSKLLKSKVG